MKKILYETYHDYDEKKRPTVARITRRVLLEELFVESLMHATKARGLLNFDANNKLAKECCLFDKVFVLAIASRVFYIFVPFCKQNHCKSTTIAFWKYSRKYSLNVDRGNGHSCELIVAEDCLMYCCH